MKYAEALESLIRGLDSSALPATGRLSGKQLNSIGKREDAWVAIDADDSLHLLLIALPDSCKKFQRLMKFKQRFLTFNVKKWIVSGQEAREYLDICCIADRKSEYRKPFIYFASDCLAELETEPTDSPTAIYRVAQRWHRFWVLSGQDEITPEWTKGLLGELWFLLDLVKAFGGTAVKTWTGPQGHDHDFQANGIAFEIKTTETMPPVLQISNLTQLDFTLFKRLWLVVYSATAHESGVTLPDVIGQLEATIEDATARDLFWQRLAEAGYRRHFENQYREYAYRKAKTLAYPVDKAFPSLTRRHLKKPLDSRIQAIRYSVKVASVSSVATSNKDFRKNLSLLCGV